MKKHNIILFVILLCFFAMPNVSAMVESKKGFINKDSVSFKSEANEGGKEVLKTLDTGDEITLLENDVIVSKVESCKLGYYRVNFYWESKNQKNYQGYVCADYITFDVDKNKYAEEFAKAGFPESYWEKLTILKDAHPDWIFTAYKTNIKWNDAVEAESVVGENGGISYIQTSNPIYLSLAPGSYDPITKKYKQMEAGGWYAANNETVAYYLDPRNFLDQVQIFMFENLGYNKTYQTESVLDNILKDTDLFQYKQHFLEAATFNGNNVSPIMLAARSRQEVVKGDGTLSGSANGESGYYNFYNLGAFSSCSNPVECAISFASGYEGKYTSYNRPWTTAEAAIKNGAQYIANGYINKKQNTLYFQKWNVTNNEYGNYSNQYMTNIEAPSSEAKSTYASYREIDGLLGSSIEFIIPVYEEMPTEVAKKPVAVDKEQLDKLEEDATTVKEISAIVNGAGYIYNKGYISGITTDTTAFSVITNLIKDDSSVNVKIKTPDSKEIIGEELIGTGYIITISNGKVEETFRFVLAGDVNGDAKITAVDYVRVKNHIMETSGLDGAYKLAADVNKDNNISAVDYVNIKNYIMGGNTVIR